jgi:hypothetical protein
MNELWLENNQLNYYSVYHAIQQIKDYSVWDHTLRKTRQDTVIEIYVAMPYLD